MIETDERSKIKQPSIQMALLALSTEIVTTELDSKILPSMAATFAGR
jgi:hypothetical protein